MKHPHSPLALALLAAAWLLMSPALVQAQKIGAKGSSEVPGTGGKKVNWKISVKQTTKKSASVWMHVTNPGTTPICLVLCAMINLEDQGANNPKHEDNAITKDGSGGYDIAPDGTKTACPPSFHFGCQRVKVAAGATSNPIDSTATFSQEGKVESMYFDILKDGPVNSKLEGENKFLYPDGIDSEDWANVWGGGGGATPLSRSITANPTWNAAWPLGNWITMGYPGFYPATLRGVLAGAPAGTQLMLITDGVPGRIYTVPRPATGGCRGADLKIEEKFTVPLYNASARIQIALPYGRCGQLKEGHRVEFYANIHARNGASFYSPDQWMYGVSYEFFWDTQPPTILSVTALNAGVGVQIDIMASDVETMPNGAKVVWTTAGGLTGEAPITWANPAMAGGVAHFSDLVTGLPAGPLNLEIHVFDEGGNVALWNIAVARSPLERQNQQAGKRR